MSRLDLRHIALMSYAWMPCTLKLAPEHEEGAMEALRQAKRTKDVEKYGLDLLASLSTYLSGSLIGASKVLHFANSRVFPIGDDRHVSKFYRKHGGQVGRRATDQQYLVYACTVQRIRSEEGFSNFFCDFETEFEQRLRRLGIEPYRVSEVRAIEICAFEEGRKL